MEYDLDMKEIINYGVAATFVFLYVKEKFFKTKGTEYDVMHKALETWKEYTTELTDRVNALTEEIGELRVENNQLKREVQNLESIIKQNKYGK